MVERPTPDGIMQLAVGFWGSKPLLSAVEIGLFTELAKGPLDAGQLSQRLGLHQRSDRDFLDALVALGMLRRNGDEYSNTSETDYVLDKAKSSYIGGMLEMVNARLYSFWGSLTEALRTGQPQSEIKSGGNYLDVLLSNPALLRMCLQCMTGLSMGANIAIAQKFP